MAGLVSLVIFGSLAKGEAGGDGNVNLLVAAEEHIQNILERLLWQGFFLSLNSKF